MQPDRIDLSSLDPTRDSARWEALVRNVSARGMAGRRSPVLWQLAAWARPSLALAAAAALVAWAPALIAWETSSATSKPVSLDAARVLSEWGASPSASSNELLSSLGATREQ